METATINDVNPTEESSTSVATESAVSADAKNESTSSVDTEVSSPTQDPVDAAINAVIEKATESSKVEETKEEGQPKAKEEPAKVEDKGPIPYERFAEVNEQKKTFEAQVQQYEPLAKAQQSIVDYCQKHNVEPEDFSKWLEIAALVKNDPVKAFEVLAPEFEKLQSFKGDKLSPELQSAVDNGEISLNLAKQLMQKEHKLKWTEENEKRQQQQRQAEKAQQYQTEMTESLTTWYQSKSKGIPEFQHKEHGPRLAKLFWNQFTAEAGDAKISDAKSLIAYAEKTMQDVLETVKPFLNKPSQQKVLRTSQTNTTASKGPIVDVDEAIKDAARKHGLVV